MATKLIAVTKKNMLMVDRFPVGSSVLYDLDKPAGIVREVLVFAKKFVLMVEAA